MTGSPRQSDAAALQLTRYAGVGEGDDAVLAPVVGDAGMAVDDYLEVCYMDSDWYDVATGKGVF